MHLSTAYPSGITQKKPQPVIITQEMSKRKTKGSQEDGTATTPKKRKEEEGPIVHTYNKVRYTMAMLNEMEDVAQFEAIVHEIKKCNCKNQVPDKYSHTTFKNAEGITITVCPLSLFYLFKHHPHTYIPAIMCTLLFIFFSCRLGANLVKVGESVLGGLNTSLLLFQCG